MASFRRDTTPSFVITIEDITDASALGTISVRLRQGGRILDITPTVSGNVLSFALTQEQTLRFVAGRNVLCQVRSIYGPQASESVPGFDIGEITVLESLYEEAKHND